MSTNTEKFREAAAILRPHGIRLRWVRREIPEPQAWTLEEVVKAKLDAVQDLPGPVLVEDSGLFIPSLKGFPGVYSKHFFKLWGFPPLLELLRRRGRHAYFKTVAGLRLGRRRVSFSGVVQGTIARRPRGRGGFGYDPLFIPRGHSRSFAELSSEEKNGLSHRARALRKLGRHEKEALQVEVTRDEMSLDVA